MSEQWTPIDGHPGYKVSSDGRILGKHGRTLRTSYVSGGLMFTVKRNGEDTTLRVARVVGKAFCPDYSPFLVPSYANGDRMDCRAKNLKWVPRGQITGVPYSMNPREVISV